MFTIKRWINKLLGRPEGPSEAEKRMDRATHDLTEKAQTTIRQTPKPAAPPMKRVGVALLCVSLLSGCAALKALGPMLLDYGIEKAEALAAKGKEAIEAARARAESIPDQLDRIEALAEVNRAELIYQTGLLEALAESELDAEWFVIPVPAPSEGEKDEVPDA